MLQKDGIPVSHEFYFTDIVQVHTVQGFPGGSVVKKSPVNAGFFLGWEKTPGEGNGNSLQYSCLENPRDREAWWATVHRVSKQSDTTWRLNNNKHQTL